MTPIDSAQIAERAQRLAKAAYYDAMAIAVEASELLRDVQPLRRRAWLAHVIDEMWSAQGGICALCGTPMSRAENPQVDHIIPFWYGGGNERGNIQLAHQRCNGKKGKEVSLPDLIAYLEDRMMNL